MSKRFARLLMWIPLAAAAPYAGSCSSGEPSAPLAEIPPELADVIFEGGGTPAALLKLLADPPKFEQARYPEFTAPPDGANLPSSAPATFTWRLVTEQAGAGPAGLLDLLGPERAARAQAAPLNGDAYYLLFSTKLEQDYVRVFTTRTSYTPDAATWQKLASAGEPLSGWLLVGTFQGDELVSERNEGTWLSFQIVP